MSHKLSHATIYVTDQETARVFYTEKLGFEVRMDVTMDYGFRWLTVGTKDQPGLELILMAIHPGGPMSEEAVGHFRALLEQGAMGPGVFETDDCSTTYPPAQFGIQSSQSIKRRAQNADS
jgi:catechol 2,3-dioxygenase-like lactoylglutathione lyase family enzyme